MADLGELELPVLLFGGPYSNLQATRAMRAEAERLGIPPHRIVCTGDVVAYCGDPAATTALIRDWGVAVVMGNVEEQIGAGAEDCGCGFEEGTACAALSRDWFAHARGELDSGAARWMAERPRVVRFSAAGLRVAAIHGGAEIINEFVFASTPLETKRRQIVMLGADIVVAGHCGLPFAEDTGAGLWVNAGVIGMPANDGTSDGWYALLLPQAGGVGVEFRRLACDGISAAASMRASGLPEAYGRALETGLWPNMDILPEAERAQRGVPLEPQGLRVQSPATK